VITRSASANEYLESKRLNKIAVALTHNINRCLHLHFLGFKMQSTFFAACFCVRARADIANFSYIHCKTKCSFGRILRHSYRSAVGHLARPARDLIDLEPIRRAQLARLLIGQSAASARTASQCSHGQHNDTLVKVNWWRCVFRIDHLCDGTSRYRTHAQKTDHHRRIEPVAAGRVEKHVIITVADDARTSSMRRYAHCTHHTHVSKNMTSN
jgi:hypothetical protein